MRPTRQLVVVAGLALASLALGLSFRPAPIGAPQALPSPAPPVATEIVETPWKRFGAVAPSALKDRFGRPVRATRDASDRYVYLVGDGPEAFSLTYGKPSEGAMLRTANGMTPGWWDGGSP